MRRCSESLSEIKRCFPCKPVLGAGQHCGLRLAELRWLGRVGELESIILSRGNYTVFQVFLKGKAFYY